MAWRKYPIHQEGSEFILADGTRAPIASHPKQSLKIDETVVQHNLEMLKGQKFIHALMHESMGGNAGYMSSAVNATVDETGRIKEFTNHAAASVTFHVQHRLKERAPSFIKAVYASDRLLGDKMNHIVAAVALLNHKRYSKK